MAIVASIVAPVNPPDICTRITDTLGTTDENHVKDFSTQLPAGTTNMAVTMQAEPGVFGEIQLLQRWYEPATQIPDLKGLPPVSGLWEFPPETAPDFTKRNMTARFVVTATGDVGDVPQVAYEHKFEVYIISFHNGYVVPSGFVAGPDQ